MKYADVSFFLILAIGLLCILKLTLLNNEVNLRGLDCFCFQSLLTLVSFTAHQRKITKVSKYLDNHFVGTCIPIESHLENRAMLDRQYILHVNLEKISSKIKSTVKLMRGGDFSMTQYGKLH